MAVKRGAQKTPITNYETKPRYQVPMDEEITSLKELRDLVEATRHLPDDTSVDCSGYSEIVVVDGIKFTARFAEYTEEDMEDLEGEVQEILENLNYTHTEVKDAEPSSSGRFI